MSTLYLVGTLLSGEVPPSYKRMIKHAKVFLDTYTTRPPHYEGIPADRQMLESNQLIDELDHGDVALVVYGDPLIATTHHTLLLEARRRGHKTEVLHGISAICAVISMSGLQVYRFGPTVTIPKMEKGFQPLSPAHKIDFNRRHNLHTLALVDPRLEYKDVLEVLRFYESHDWNPFPFMVVKTYHDMYWIDEYMHVDVDPPFSLVFPANLHPVEQEFVDIFAKKRRKK